MTNETTGIEVSTASAGRTEFALLSGRCATCKYWQGSEDKVIKQLEAAKENENLEKYLDLYSTWACDGKCDELRANQNIIANSDYAYAPPEVEAVFGCLLHEAR